MKTKAKTKEPPQDDSGFIMKRAELAIQMIAAKLPAGAVYMGHGTSKISGKPGSAYLVAVLADEISPLGPKQGNCQYYCATILDGDDNSKN